MHVLHMCYANAFCSPTAIVLSSHLNPCDLHCQMRGSHIIHTLTSNVSDGASCLVHKHGRYEPGVCTNRQCVSVGCDRQLNSPGRYDQCGVWCGNNGTCRSVTGEYSHHVAAGSSVNRGTCVCVCVHVCVCVCVRAP